MKKLARNRKIRKNIQKSLKVIKLDIAIQCNMKIVSYLDATLNLNNLNYKPYYKSDKEILHIQVSKFHFK